MTTIIDSDEHLYEPRGLWRDHADPSARNDAIRIEDDDLGASGCGAIPARRATCCTCTRSSTGT